MVDKEKQLEDLKHILRNGAAEIAGILKHMTKAIKEYEKPFKNKEKGE